MAETIALRGRGNNGNELIVLERATRGDPITVTRDGVTATREEAAASLVRQRGDVLDAFVRGDPIEDFETRPTGDPIVRPPVEEIPARG